MSLLLEALKKAERAKEEAQRRADAGSEAERTQLRLEGDAAADGTAERKPLMTRDKLPDISAPLEIVSNDLAPAPSAPAPQPVAPAERPRPEARAADTQPAERATARKVFEAKFREPNPRMPFYIAMGCLGAFAVGTVIYFYLQLRSPPSLVNANPPRQAAEAAAPAVAETRPAASAAASAAAQPIPGLPGGAAQAPAPVAAAKPPAAVAPQSRATPAVPRVPQSPPRARFAPPAQAAREEFAPAPAREPGASRGEAQVHPKVESGYAAYLAGDPAAARSAYQQALAENPANRDALLGIAALDVRAGRFETAEASYLRLLQADPRDSYAHAALIALRGGRLDPLVAESRVKSLLAADPGSHVLNFALGNQFAQQGRWAEAQQEYFKALAAEPDNPDFAYNLAVSLDHLRQPRLAREHYQRAVALAEKRGASFDVAAARARAAQLEK